MAEVENRGTLARLTDRAGLTPTQENLARVSNDFPDHKLNISDSAPSKVVAFLQKGINELGEKGLMGADFKPLDVTGVSSPAFIAAVQNYLADKRTHDKDVSIPSYQGLPEVKGAGDIGVLHISAMMDSLQDNGVLKKGSVTMKPELLEALREVNHGYLKLGIEALEGDLKQQGIPVTPSKAAAAESDNPLQPYLDAHRAATGQIFKTSF
jgi:hypothetical protein